MEIIGWPTNVNQKILSDTSITEGEGGKVEDSTSNGFKETRATSLVTPKKYNVKMDFDWGGSGSEFQYPVDSQGLTEYDRFVRWFELVHQKGAKPFWFPCITKQSIDVLDVSQSSGMALYKITSSLSEQQSGYSMSITMTWEEVYSGIINISDESAITLKSVTGINGKCKCVLSDYPASTPRFDELSVTCDGTAVAIGSVLCTNNILSLLYKVVAESGSHTIAVKYKDGDAVSYTINV